VFTDKASGKDAKRLQLEMLMSFVRTGDTVVVHSMDRLARNLDDLRRIVQALTGKGVRIEFVKERLSFTGEDSPMANLMLSAWEHSLSSRGRSSMKGGGKGLPLLNSGERTRGERNRWQYQVGLESGWQAASAKQRRPREFGISRQTLYQYLRG
jgi:DNA invertase Pin-like site-specific DNA recombinase